MGTSLALSEHRPWRERYFPNGEWVLALALAVELAIFAAIGENFFTLANFFEVVRLSVELGLLALAMTPIMITGGIDLSVGSTMGLAAVVFGALWRDGGCSIAVAAGAAILLGCLAGLLNAVLITRLNIPPLIVTLGSLSLFRGIAEGITKGAENYSGFPQAFLRAGPGISRRRGAGAVLRFWPSRIVGYWVLLHRSAIGRTIYAIGFSPGRRALCGHPRAEARSPSVLPLGAGRQRGRHHLCGAPGAGEIGRGHGLRTGRHHGRGARRHFGLRRPRNHLGHGARPLRDLRAAKRTAPGGAAHRR